MKFNDLRDVYVSELKDLYDAESRLAETLPRMATKASSPELKRAFQSHLDETKEQRVRIERICEELGEQPTGVTCEAIRGLIAESQKVLDADGDSNACDAALIAAGNRVEHYEMAGYGAARAHARLLGFDNQARLLQKTLDEEGKADHHLMSLAKKVNPTAVHHR